MQQPDIFPSGDDLPIFTGAPVKVQVKPFNPKPQADQPALFDLRPQFGAMDPAQPVQPNPELFMGDQP